MKKQINLYQPSCYPKREKFTGKQFLFLAGICFLLVLALHLTLNNKFSKTQAIAAQHKALLTIKQTELAALVTELQNNRAPDSKIREQLALQTEIDAKQRLLGSLSGIELGRVVEFSELMRGLSLASMSAISIDHFSIIDGRLNISGQAKESDSVPLWLTKIQTTNELAGIAFEKIKISDIAGGFSFQLSNNPKNKKAKAPAQ
ncbi:MAG: hypothetical protein ACJAT7_002590 [Psychromonas sp.]|jgi:hypothetical protein|uniref:hypothetical protein n=1 Tax=Psychromonas sp. TaxID=1884585 RepID=UPI0039E6B8C0